MKRCWYVILAFFLFSCSPRALHEAQDVVSQADSLWQQGDMYRDSVSLAQAYSTLGNWKWFYADEYAHSCYHYGKLLRAQDDPVSAMQVFINATHTPTHDYHILGRVYSNMGDIAHLAGEYSLAYDMYEESANMYLSNGDSLLYYYGLNNMAYELAESGEKDRAYIILGKIKKENAGYYLSAKMLETRANACKQVQQYDSTIYYAKMLYDIGFLEPTPLILIAQAYSYKGQKDTATYYAKKVLASSPSLSDLNNALYIFANDDITKDIEGVRKASADRADVQKLLEIRQGEVSQAVQLLEQDIHREPDLKWLYATCITILIIGIGLYIIVRRRRRKHALLSQQLNKLQQANMKAKEKRDELSNAYSVNRNRMQEEINHMCTLLREDPNIEDALSWKDYEDMCSTVDKHFYMLASKLHKHRLKEKEVRLCILVLLDLSRKDIAATLPYAVSGVGKLKDQTAKSLGTTGKNLHDFLIKMAIEG